MQDESSNQYLFIYLLSGFSNWIFWDLFARFTSIFFLQELRIIYSDICFYFIPNPATPWDNWAEQEWLVQSHPDGDYHRVREILGYSIHFTFLSWKNVWCFVSCVSSLTKEMIYFITIASNLNKQFHYIREWASSLLKTTSSVSLLDLFLSDPPHYTFLPIVATRAADFITFCLKW